jgi:hypothetical protein
MLWGLAVLGCYQPPDDWALAVLRASYHMLKENSMQHQVMLAAICCSCDQQLCKEAGDGVRINTASQR